MIVEREREIQNFKPEESWKVSALLKNKEAKVKVNLHKIDGKVKKFKSEEDVKKFLHTLFKDFNIEEKQDKKGNKLLSIKNKKDFLLENIDKKDSKRVPQAPFTTSTLQQEASRKYGFSVKKTMMVAQKLYEGIEL